MSLFDEGLVALFDIKYLLAKIVNLLDHLSTQIAWRGSQSVHLLPDNGAHENIAYAMVG